jgi:cell division protein FtsB
MQKKRLPLLFFLVFLVLLLGFAGYASYRQFERTKRIKSEVSALQAQADKIRQENENLSERISYFSSREYQEQEAKDKLDLQKTDETVVGVKEMPKTEESGTEPRVETSKEEGALPVYLKWWRLFFSQPAS